MRKNLLGAALAIILVVGAPIAYADIITFNLTGRMTILAPDGSVFANGEAQGLIDPYGYQTPISAALSFDTASGIGSSNLQISMVNFISWPAFFHDISFTRQNGTNLLDGTMLIDWGPNSNLISNIQWDATGMINAIDYGLQVGDKISGSSLYRDFNHDGQYDTSELVVSDLGSAIPYTDGGLLPYGSTQYWYPNQGPAPMAATGGLQGCLAARFPEHASFSILAAATACMSLPSRPCRSLALSGCLEPACWVWRVSCTDADNVSAGQRKRASAWKPFFV